VLSADLATGTRSTLLDEYQAQAAPKRLPPAPLAYVCINSHIGGRSCGPAARVDDRGGRARRLSVDDCSATIRMSGRIASFENVPEG